jgi:hypothetical protein
MTKKTQEKQEEFTEFHSINTVQVVKNACYLRGIDARTNEELLIEFNTMEMLEWVVKHRDWMKSEAKKYIDELVKGEKWIK